MDTLPEEIQNTIYRYKHELEFTNVLSELIQYRDKPKIYFCYGCCEFYPMWMKCDCVGGDENYDTDGSDFSDDSDDFWMYDL